MIFKPVVLSESLSFPNAMQYFMQKRALGFLLVQIGFDENLLGCVMG
jgi:hypothetical protein